MPETTNGDGNSNGWMSDVQRAIALILVGTFAILCIIGTIRLVILGDSASITDMSKTLQAALVNMALIALGFFFGSNMSKMLADAGQQKIVEKLTSTAPPGPPGPVAPIPPAVVAWWSLLTDAEKTAITAAAPADAKVQSFVTASSTGKAAPDDLAYLVTKGLLTQDRATAIQAV